jgi:hypothetical protein
MVVESTQALSSASGLGVALSDLLEDEDMDVETNGFLLSCFTGAREHCARVELQRMEKQYIKTALTYTYINFSHAEATGRNICRLGTVMNSDNRVLKALGINGNSLPVSHAGWIWYRLTFSEEYYNQKSIYMYMPKTFSYDFPGSVESAEKFLDEERADPTPLPTDNEWNEFYEFFGSVVFDPSSGAPQLFPGVVGIPEVLDADKQAMGDALEKLRPFVAALLETDTSTRWKGNEAISLSMSEYSKKSPIEFFIGPVLLAESLVLGNEAHATLAAIPEPDVPEISGCPLKYGNIHFTEDAMQKQFREFQRKGLWADPGSLGKILPARVALIRFNRLLNQERYTSSEPSPMVTTNLLTSTLIREPVLRLVGLFNEMGEAVRATIGWVVRGTPSLPCIEAPSPDFVNTDPFQSLLSIEAAPWFSEEGYTTVREIRDRHETVYAKYLTDTKDSLYAQLLCLLLGSDGVHPLSACINAAIYHGVVKLLYSPLAGDKPKGVAAELFALAIRTSTNLSTLDVDKHCFACRQSFRTRVTVKEVPIQSEFNTALCLHCARPKFVPPPLYRIDTAELKQRAASAGLQGTVGEDYAHDLAIRDQLGMSREPIFCAILHEILTALFITLDKSRYIAVSMILEELFSRLNSMADAIDRFREKELLFFDPECPDQFAWVIECLHDTTSNRVVSKSEAEGVLRRADETNIENAIHSLRGRVWSGNLRAIGERVRNFHPGQPSNQCTPFNYYFPPGTDFQVTDAEVNEKDAIGMVITKLRPTTDTLPQVPAVLCDPVKDRERKFRENHPDTSPWLSNGLDWDPEDPSESVKIFQLPPTLHQHLCQMNPDADSDEIGTGKHCSVLGRCFAFLLENMQGSGDTESENQRVISAHWGKVDSQRWPRGPVTPTDPLLVGSITEFALSCTPWLLERQERPGSSSSSKKYYQWRVSHSNKLEPSFSRLAQYHLRQELVDTQGLSYLSKEMALGVYFGDPRYHGGDTNVKPLGELTTECFMQWLSKHQVALGFRFTKRPGEPFLKGTSYRQYYVGAEKLLGRLDSENCPQRVLKIADLNNLTRRGSFTFYNADLVPVDVVEVPRSVQALLSEQPEVATPRFATSSAYWQVKFHDVGRYVPKKGHTTLYYRRVDFDGVGATKVIKPQDFVEQAMGLPPLSRVLFVMETAAIMLLRCVKLEGGGQYAQTYREARWSIARCISSTPDIDAVLTTLMDEGLLRQSAESWYQLSAETISGNPRLNTPGYRNLMNSSTPYLMNIVVRARSSLRLFPVDVESPRMAEEIAKLLRATVLESNDLRHAEDLQYQEYLWGAGSQDWYRVRDFLAEAEPFSSHRWYR